MKRKPAVNGVEYKVVDRPPDQALLKPSASSSRMRAIRETAETGQALFFPASQGCSLSVLRNRIAGNSGRELTGAGYRVRVRQAADGTGLYVWAEKRNKENR